MLRQGKVEVSLIYIVLLDLGINASKLFLASYLRPLIHSPHIMYAVSSYECHYVSVKFLREF